MRIPNVLLIACLLLIPPLLCPQQEAHALNDRPALVYVLSVSRHGVRSPTGKSAQYDRYASAPWPTWTVEPGYLTPHGYELMRLLGGYHRADLSSKGLFTAIGCTDAGKVTFHADSDQRTRETAKALATGMFPGCTVSVQALSEGTNDPLFHSPAGSVTPAEAQRGAAAIAGRIGGSPSSIAETHHALLARLDDILQTCGPKSADHQRTSLFDIPAVLAPGDGDHVADMRGPLNTAATLSENILLEYTEGMPAKDVAWGCVDGPRLRELIALHTAAFDLAQRTSAIANVQAAALLRTIAASLQQAATGKPVLGATGRPGDKALFLVGHDTNLANLAGALQLNWTADGRRNDTPPGSALVFELWKLPASGGFAVRLYFTTQTLEQMRNATALDAGHPPANADLVMPRCGNTESFCPLSEFITLLGERTEHKER